MQHHHTRQIPKNCACHYDSVWLPHGSRSREYLSVELEPTCPVHGEHGSLRRDRG